MNRSPAFSFYPDKWLTHTRHLTPIARDVYHEIICWMWMQDDVYCSIPADPEAIACLLAIDEQLARHALAEIQNKHRPLLDLRGDRLFSKGLEKEREIQRKRREESTAAINTRWARERAKQPSTPVVRP